MKNAFLVLFLFLSLGWTSERVRLLGRSLDVEKQIYRSVYSYDSNGLRLSETRSLNGDTLLQILSPQGVGLQSPLFFRTEKGMDSLVSIPLTENEFVQKNFRAGELVFEDRLVLDGQGRLVERHRNESGVPFRILRSYQDSLNFTDSLFEGGQLLGVQTNQTFNGVALRSDWQFSGTALHPISNQSWDENTQKRLTWEGDRQRVLLKSEGFQYDALGLLRSIVEISPKGQELASHDFDFFLFNQMALLQIDSNIRLEPGFQELGFSLIDPDGDSLSVRLLGEFAGQFELLSFGDSLVLRGFVPASQVTIPLEITDPWGVKDTLMIEFDGLGGFLAVHENKDSDLFNPQSEDLFSGLKDWSEIQIFNVGGGLVHHWSEKQKEGFSLSFGAYFYLIKFKNGAKRAGSLLFKPKDSP